MTPLGRVAATATLALLPMLGSCGDEATDRAADSTGTVATTDTLAPAGATAVWETTPGESIGPAVESITASVTRLGCNNGVTGEVYPPQVERTSSEIVITFWVEPLPPDVRTCPSNDRVPIVVDLGEPLGHRSLVDGACLAEEAVSTAFCWDGSARYVPT